MVGSRCSTSSIRAGFYRGITIGARSVSWLAFEVDTNRMQQLIPLVRTAAHTVIASPGGPQHATTQGGA